MAIYSIEVEPVATALLTGRLGTAIAVFRGREYRVPIGGGTDVTCDGVPTKRLPVAVRRFALQQSEFLIREYKRRESTHKPE